ncbi:hypothetical protein SAMD00019534_038090 [Acytostelium subglobosum LB1]|uniref:hypothetical protein n=1 Tax=Acytostelium subglobosum LB1 TaxID=1410327 RepID=UPI000644CCFB|nr:hypothetical protein SAMD00019534_038090 [Acytostelium subglobosum LB1]GAM20634.1 hypothetical protein SAMD00019534_038090 [Acytostelium subglobosum LB1]|eukprot:XP_012760155.1 hypothetical protein SAMD00019534_038090 [Acytostelium subglobosum LB1]
MATSTKIIRPPEPWVSKYRPKTVDDVSHQDEVVKALKRSLETGNLPHLLFYGPPGTGKTSTVLAVAMDLYGPELYKDRVLELNASDERGIEVVRTKIKSFASFTVNQQATVNGRPAASFKLIILDEADSMTHDAQAALRRTIENTSKTTRFCLLCNYITRIIEPLSSRCAKFRFRSLDDTAMTERLTMIADKEGMRPLSDPVLKAIQQVSDGDLRKAITYLQSVYRFYGKDKVLTPDTIFNISGTVPNELIDGLFKTCLSGSYEKLEKNVQRIIANGYPAAQILSQLFDYVVATPVATNKQKAMITIKMGSVDRNLIDGSEEFLQLLDAASYIMNQMTNQ